MALAHFVGIGKGRSRFCNIRICDAICFKFHGCIALRLPTYTSNLG